MRVAVVGAGRVGRTLGVLARRAGYAIGPVVSRTMERAREACAFIGAGEPGTSPAGAELTLLCVPDAAIAETARRVSAPPGAVLAHTCASYGADALRPWRPAGALHPLRSFADPARAAERFAGTFCAVDGDPEAAAALESFARAIGGRPFAVKTERKALYHAGAVFGSNYVVAALAAARRLLEAAGVPREAAAEALGVLAEGTVLNVKAVGAEAALTGPVERGDAGTLRRHAAALAEHAPELSDAYAVLARITADVALAKGSIGPEAAAALAEAARP